MFNIVSYVQLQILHIFDLTTFALDSLANTEIFLLSTVNITCMISAQLLNMS